MKIPFDLQFFAAGRVCTGFSKPYVAKYNASGGVVTFTEGRILARGVNVSVEPNSSDDNKFYADNQNAESSSGIFTGGTLTLTVDGLYTDAERFIQGIPAADADGWVGYGDNKETPYIAVGYIARYQSDGIVTYVPTVICKTKFGLFNQAAATQEDQIDWQTQELTANIMRADDPNHNWKFISETEYTTEAEAERALQTKMGVYVANPLMLPMDDGVNVFGTLVSDLQTGITVAGGKVTGELKYIEEGSLVTTWGEGNFLAVKFLNIDPRATSIRVGLNPSESSGLIEIIDDPDKAGVFKITNKDTQKFTIISSDGTHTTTTEYDLSGLTLDSGD